MSFDSFAAMVGFVGTLVGAARWGVPQARSRLRRLRPAARIVFDAVEAPLAVQKYYIVFIKMSFIAERRPLTITGVTCRALKGGATLAWENGVVEAESPTSLCFGVDNEHIRRNRADFVPFPFDVEVDDAATTYICLRVRPVAGRRPDQDIQVEFRAIAVGGAEVGRATVTFTLP